jgi:hypothetical protein
MATVKGVRWNFSVVFICISFMARDEKHFFMCFLAIWVSSFEKVLFSSLAHFFIGSLILGELSFLSSLYSGCQSFVWCIFGKYFLPLCGCSLQFRDHFFCCAEPFNIMKSYLSILSLTCWAAGVLLRKSLPIPVSSTVFPASSFTNFRVLGLILRSLIHFELILVQGDRHKSSFSFL